MVAVIFLSGWFYRWQETDYLEAKTIEQNRKVFSVLSAMIIEPLITEDRPMLESMLSQVTATLHNIHSVEVLNEEGLRLSHWEVRNDVSVSRLVSFTDDIVFEGESFGSIEVYWDLTRQYADIDTHVTQMRLLVSGVLIVLTAVIIVIVHLLAVRHLNRINSRVMELAKGDLSSQISVSASKESSGCWVQMRLT